MNQQNIDYLSLLGYQYLSHGRFGAAVAVFEGALVLEPDDGNLKRSLAYAYLNLGRCQECLEILERIGEPEDRTIQLIRSRALWKLGRTEEARHVAARIVAAAVGKPDVR